MKKFISVVLFIVLTELILVEMFCFETYIENHTCIDSIWMHVFIVPFMAVVIMTIIKLLLFRQSKSIILAIGFGSAIIILEGIGYYYREVPGDFYYRLAFIFMRIITFTSFIYSFVAVVVLRKIKDKAEHV